MRAFLEAFGRQLAIEIWRSVVGLTVIGAVLGLLERHSRRQFAAELTRMVQALKSAK